MSESRFSVYSAICANVAIAITKFVAAASSGSSALFAEALHSTVDTGDGLLLLLGLYLSRKPASPRHPYGRGSEVYFWSMVVAMSIFGMGGVVSIYEGIVRWADPHPFKRMGLGFGVLAAAFLFEGASLIIASRSFRKYRGKRGIWEGIKKSKNPTTFVVLLEDSAALCGIVIAALGLWGAHALQTPELDALASILIGMLLVLVGIVLGRETWSLLIGESASDELVSSVEALARNQPGVADVKRPATLHLGPERVHVDLDLHLDADANAVEIAKRIEDEVRDRHPVIHRVSFRFT
jgi:cation diffusion facilitator family transporter